MRNVIQRINVHPVYSKIYSWSKLITITGSAQIVVQAASLFCGILVIRLLPTHEYALYTLSNTMLGTMTLLADSGISAGVMSIGGKVWQDKKQLGAVLATGLQLRRKFAVFSLLIAVPLLVYLLLFHGATWLTTLMIALSLIPAFFAALSDSLLEIPPKLHQDIKLLQRNQVLVSVLRLALSGLFLFIFPFTFIAILASGLPRSYGNIRLRKITEKFTEKQKPDRDIEKDILKIVKRIMPGAVYYCFISQISIWLISIFGTTTSIAQVGALGRLGMAINVFSVMMTTLVVPRFARLPKNRKVLRHRFFQIMLMLFALCLVVIGFALLFPEQILYILGKQYAGLRVELVLSILVSCLVLLVGMIHSINIARGYVISPLISIGVHLISQIILVTSLNLSTTKNVLVFSSIDNFIVVFMFMANFVYYVYKEPVVDNKSVVRS